MSGEKGDKQNNGCGCGCLIGCLIFLVVLFVGSWAWTFFTTHWGLLVALVAIGGIVAFLAVTLYTGVQRDKVEALRRQQEEQEKQRQFDLQFEARLAENRKRNAQFRREKEARLAEEERIHAENQKRIERLHRERETRLAEDRLRQQKDALLSEEKRNLKNGLSIFNQAKEAIAEKNYVSGYHLLLQAAEADHPEAQLLLGDYFSNEFDPISAPESEALLCPECNGQISNSNSRCLDCGTHLLPAAFHAPEVNFVEACKWYVSAHKHGLEEATYRLCIARYFGLGVPKHFPTARKLYDSIKDHKNTHVYPPHKPQCLRRWL